MPPIRTIFFDFGNVLCFFDHQRAVRRLCSFTNRSPTELTLQLYGGVLEEDYEVGTLTTEQYVSAALKDAHLRCTHEEFVDSFTDIFTPNEAVHRLIPQLKPHYRLVLASNTNDAHYTFYRKEYASVMKHFDHLCVSHEARTRKPHPEFFAYCQQFAEAAPEECLFIDDLASNIEAALAFGWRGIVYIDPLQLLLSLRQNGIQGIDDELASFS